MDFSMFPSLGLKECQVALNDTTQVLMTAARKGVRC